MQKLLEKRYQLEIELNEIRKLIKEKCKHDYVRYIPGTKDFQSRQWWVYPAYECLTCKTYFSSDPDQNTSNGFNNIDKKVQSCQ